MRKNIMWVAAAATFMSASLVLAQTEAGTDPGTDSPAATKGRSDPEPEGSRRSGVAGAPMDPGSGAQGSGTEEGPDGRGLTGNEGRDDTADYEYSEP